MADISEIGKDDDKRTEHIENRHDRDNLLGDRSDALHAAEEDESRNNRDNHADQQFVDAESRFKRHTDRV